MSFSSTAWAICDRCGFRYRHRDLKKETSGILVCPTCHDGAFDIMNHPQNFSAEAKAEEEGLEDARPDDSQVSAVTWTPTSSSVPHLGKKGRMFGQV